MHFIPLLVAVGLVIGAIIYWQVTLVLAAIGLVVYLIRRENNLAKKLLAEHEAKLAEQERQGEISRTLPLDLILMNQEYDRLYPTATKIDGQFVEATIMPALAGKPITGNEFERRDFEHNRKRKVDEIKTTIFHLKAFVGFFALGDYDFEARYFPAHMHLSIHRGRPNPWTIDLYFPGWERLDGKDSSWLRARLPIADVERARHLRESRPSIEAALLIFRPVEALYQGGRHGIDTLGLTCELLGVRLQAVGGSPFIRASVA